MHAVQGLLLIKDIRLRVDLLLFIAQHPISLSPPPPPLPTDLPARPILSGELRLFTGAGCIPLLGIMDTHVVSMHSTLMD